jgi:hypothetical protein
LDKPKDERSLLAFAAEALGPDPWEQYCHLVRKYYAVLDRTPMAMKSATDALCERWAGLRTNPQSFIYEPLLLQIEQFEANIDAGMREALQSGQYVATGFVGIDEQPVPARIFRDAKVRIWLGQSEIELPDGTVIRAVVINPAAPVVDVPASSKRRMGERQSAEPRATQVNTATKRTALQKWIAGRYTQGIPAGMTQKEIARDFKTDTGTVVDVRTVRRALGRK